MTCDTSYGFLKASDARKCARDNAVIFEEICAIQQAILTAIGLKQYETTVANNTAMTGISGIISVNVNDGGADYFPIVAAATITHPTGVNAAISITSMIGGTIQQISVTNGGTGYQPIPATISSISRLPNANAILTPIQTGGQITSFVINDAGTGYHVGDDITIIHGTGTNATAEVSTINMVNGAITGIVITNAGSNYDNTGLSSSVVRIPPVTATGTINVNNITGAITGITFTNAGAAYHVGDHFVISHPSGASANIQVGTIGVSGNITGVSIINGGTGYQTVVAKAEITHPTGTAFRANVIVNNSGIVTGVNILNGGIGYGNLLPTVTATDTNGSGATFNVVVDNAGVITNVNVLNKGSNYSHATTLTVHPAPASIGAGAIVEPVLETYNNGSIYYKVFAGLVTDREIDDQIQFVLDYFTQLGYNIKAYQNPLTLNTLQWHIMW